MDFARLRALPALGVGLLLNPDTLASSEVETEAAYQYFEVIPDRFWLDAGPGTSARHRELGPSVAALDELAARVPIVCHSIGLSIGSASLFDRGHLDQIARWQRRYGFAWHSDHLAFSRLAGHGAEVNAAVTLPLTRDDESLRMLTERVTAVSEHVDGPFLLENNVYFVTPPDEPYGEAAFLNELCARSGCGLLLDLHNLHVNATNHGFAAEALLDELDLRQVVEIHIAGGDELAGFYTDSHAGPVAPAVWPLLERTLCAAPWVRGVTFEYHESYAAQVAGGGVARELPSCARDLGALLLRRRATPLTLAAYQDAFARMVLSPALCRRARAEGEAAFAEFAMDAAERARLLHIARQPGMRITCILARANRLGSLAGALPLCCELLKPELGPLLDRYWEAHPMASLQALPAGLAFAGFLRQEIELGRVTAEYALDVLRFEVAGLELQLAIHAGGNADTAPRVRELHFAIDPTPLLAALGARAPLSGSLPDVPTTLVLDHRCDPPQVTVRHT